MALARRKSSKISAEESIPESDDDEYNIHESSYAHKHWPQPPVSKPNQKNREEDCAGIEILYRAFPSHHACGPQDNAGKDPRIAMERSIGFAQSTNIYNYHECLSWCERNMKTPSERHSHEGTWGCNGKFV